MSVKQMGMVWEHEFGHGEMIVMLALADHAHDDGTEIRPSVARLAWKTGYEVRQIQRILKHLRDDLGILVLVKRGGGRGNPNVYRFDWTKGVKKTPFNPQRVSSETLTSEQRVTSAQERVTLEELNGDTAMSPEPSVIEPSVNNTTKVVDGEPSPGIFVGYLREELDGSDVPLLRNREDRYAAEFKKLLAKDVTPEILYKICDRIIERWRDDLHYKLSAEQAMEDVVNGKPKREDKPPPWEPVNPHSPRKKRQLTPEQERSYEERMAMEAKIVEEMLSGR